MDRPEHGGRMSGYPAEPGQRDLFTSAAAARRIAPDAARFRAMVLNRFRQGDWTADEIAADLGISILTVRPRVTELKKLGHIEPTGGRRTNPGGSTVRVWRITDKGRAA